MHEKAKFCEDCLGWLHHCYAECCRTLRIEKALFCKKNLLGANKDRLIIRNYRLSSDMRKYYLLHNCRVIHDSLIIPFTGFVVDGEFVILDVKCTALTDDSLCGVHENKPLLCQTEGRLLGSKGNRFTPNCLFKFKEENKNGTKS